MNSELLDVLVLPADFLRGVRAALPPEGAKETEDLLLGCVGAAQLVLLNLERVFNIIERDRPGSLLGSTISTLSCGMVEAVLWPRQYKREVEEGRGENPDEGKE